MAHSWSMEPYGAWCTHEAWSLHPSLLVHGTLTKHETFILSSLLWARGIVMKPKTFIWAHSNSNNCTLFVPFEHIKSLQSFEAWPLDPLCVNPFTIRSPLEHMSASWTPKWFSFMLRTCNLHLWVLFLEHTSAPWRPLVSLDLSLPLTQQKWTMEIS